MKKCGSFLITPIIFCAILITSQSPATADNPDILGLPASKKSEAQANTPASRPGEHSGAQEREKPGKLKGLAGLHNFGVVENGIYRGAQPSAEGYVTLKRMGVRSVLNLRNDKDEKAAVKAAGMKPLEVPMGMLRHIDRENVEKAVSIMTDPANQPIFVHCLKGQDRTGVVVAAYRMEVDGWALPEAEKEMQSYGFNDVWVNLKHLIHKLAADQGKTR